MKKINKIFIWAFVIISLLPFFEYFLFQWRNDNRISITSTTQMGTVSLNDNYVSINLPLEINSFSDYIVMENYYGTLSNNSCNQQGLPKLLFLTTIRVLRLFYNKNSATSGGFQLQIMTISFLLSRTIFVAVLLLLTYITVLPVVLIFDLLHRRLMK